MGLPSKHARPSRTHAAERRSLHRRLLGAQDRGRTRDPGSAAAGIPRPAGSIRDMTISGPGWRAS
jgi:hypothetical protein